MIQGQVYPSERHIPGQNQGIRCGYPEYVCDCIEYVGGPLEPEFGVGAAKGHDVVGHNHNLLNRPWTDDIIFQTRQKVQPPLSDHVLHEYEVFLWETLEVLGVIYLNCEYVSTHQLQIYKWDQAVFAQIPRMNKNLMR